MNGEESAGVTSKRPLVLEARYHEGRQNGPLPNSGMALVAVQINILLAAFNLLPIPPLDGFSVLVGVAPQPLADRLNELRRYGPYLLIGIFLLIWLIPQGTIIITGPAQWLFEFLLDA